jgi:carboxymethylenebutenolidase
MGELVEFPSNAHTASGYLAVPESGSGPGLIVIQEWWGLVPHILDVCDRYAAEGFVALAPDLYHGQTTTEPDEAGKLMMTMNLEQAAKDMGGAVNYLEANDAVTSTGLGVTGYCMGGGLALMLAVQRAGDIAACAPYYGLIPWESAEPDWSLLQAPVQGHYAANDGYFTPEMVHGLDQKLQDLGKQAEFEIHDGADHAFFNDTRPEVYDADESAKAWAATVAFLHENVQ